MLEDKPKNIPIYVTTSDGYIKVLKVFCFLFNKFWDSQQEVNIVGFKPPQFDLPNNFKFISLGKQRGVNYWREDLLNMVELIKEDFFIHMEENELFMRHVDLNILNCLKDKINDNVGRIDLTPGISNRQWELIENKKDYDIIELSQYGEYRIALRANIWNKKYIKKFLNLKQDDWLGFEISASEVAKNDGHQILATNRKYAINNFDGVWHDQWRQFPDSIDFDQTVNKRSNYGMKFEQNTIDEMIKSNIIKKQDNGLYKIL